MDSDPTDTPVDIPLVLMSPDITPISSQSGAAEPASADADNVPSGSIEQQAPKAIDEPPASAGTGLSTVLESLKSKVHDMKQQLQQVQQEPDSSAPSSAATLAVLASSLYQATASLPRDHNMVGAIKGQLQEMQVRMDSLKQSRETMLSVKRAKLETSQSFSAATSQSSSGVALQHRSLVSLVQQLQQSLEAEAEGRAQSEVKLAALEQDHEWLHHQFEECNHKVDRMQEHLENLETKVAEALQAAAARASMTDLVKGQPRHSTRSTTEDELSSLSLASMASQASLASLASLAQLPQPDVLEVNAQPVSIRVDTMPLHEPHTQTQNQADSDPGDADQMMLATMQALGNVCRAQGASLGQSDVAKRLTLTMALMMVKRSAGSPQTLNVLEQVLTNCLDVGGSLSGGI